MWRAAPSSPSCPSSDRFLLGHINTAEGGSETAAESEKSDVRTSNTVRGEGTSSASGAAVEVTPKMITLSIYILELLQFSFDFFK